MAITDYIDFVNNYLTKNGMIGNAANLNKAPDQLKKEIDELNTILNDSSSMLALINEIGGSENVPETVVIRDDQGNIAVNKLIGDLTGTADKSKDVVGGTAGSLLFQSEVDNTDFVAPGTPGYFLQSTGTGAPVWAEVSGGTGESPIVKPTIVSPANGTTNYTGAVTATYTKSETYLGSQNYVEWQASTTNTFGTLLDSYTGTSNLLSWTPTVVGGLTTVYVRTRQGSDNHLSVWSNPVNFTTPNIYVKSPTLSVTGAPSSVTLTPTLTGSSFSVMNGTDTHISTDWQVLKASDSSVVWESLNNTQNKLSITTSTLPKNTDLKFRVRYKGGVYGSSDWAEVSAKTLNIYVNNPTLTVEGTPSSIGDKPVLTSSAFSVSGGTDTHKSTDWVIEQSGTVVWSSMNNTTNKLSITVPAGYLVESTQYTFKVRHNGNTYGSSAYVTVNGTTKSQFFDYDSGFGGELEGGYYAGKIQRADGVYALIVAPKATGQSSALQWKNVQTTSGGCKSLNDGAANTAHMVANGNATVYPAAHFCNNLVINGYSDWYLPARDELEIAYRNLKPTTDANYTSARGDSSYVYTLYDDISTEQGVNRHSVPTGAAYTTSNPAQTSLAPFKQGGAESFYNDTYSRHWSSTEYGSTLAWFQNFSGSTAGYQVYDSLTTSVFCRAFRAVKIS